MLPTGNDLNDARLIVKRVLGVSLEPVAPCDPVARYDFELSQGGRCAGVMVVARARCPSPHELPSASRRYVWVAVGQRSWTVRLETVSRARPDGHMIVGLLAELEAAGGKAFQRADQVRVAALRAAGVRLSPAERVLEDLAVFGVVGAECDAQPHDPPTVVAAEHPADNRSVDSITEVVEDETWRPATRARFTGCDGDRHLFVWLDSAGVDPAAIDPDEVPPPPRPAPETTTLWAARRPSAAVGLLADRVWQTNAAGEWEALGSVSYPASSGVLVDSRV